MEDPEGQLFLFRARKNLAKMLMDRGFESPTLTQLYGTDFKDLKGKTKVENLRLEMINTSETRQIVVNFIATAEKFKKEDLLKLIDYSVGEAKENQLDTHLLIVLMSKPNSTLEKVKIEQNHQHKSIKVGDKRVYVYGEIWHAEDLQYNVTESNLVPRHQLMLPEEISKLLAEMNIVKVQLPKIKHNDPVARYFGARPGDVMKVERIVESSGISFYYRMVV